MMRVVLHARFSRCVKKNASTYSMKILVVLMVVIKSVGGFQKHHVY